MNPVYEKRFAPVMVAVTGVVAIIAYAGVALMQILVWNPEAAVPGLSADEVWREVGAANQGPPNAFVIGVLAVGPLLALVFLILFAVTDVGVWPTAASYLGLLATGMTGYFVASFGPGMGLADTYPISGGDYALGGVFLYGVSVLAMIGLLGIFVGALVRHRRERSALASA
ncbi:hypothetical protein [Microbacterium sp. VKM Ac-2923]|uniref:hypothetical protein n=1 Tax=Microbacterium sp. VKM Ac-2923 TaxID=2929476 RepID=UPI001FB49555|nr:hypothetical protein [Microbacterium sp. VKM Ac-2923]MCJ1708744.1 hypothetical protein [Microbacterium sp. VKM Ac-2923]